MKAFITEPLAIEEKSMRIIEEELGAEAEEFTAVELEVVKRIIHTTADFEYARLFCASPGAVALALEAFSRGGRVIVADTNMIVAGINKNLLESCAVQAACLVAEEETRRRAEEEGLTRSMINIRRAAEKFPGAIYAIGNAPTALYELLRLVEIGRVKPAMVIGVPVGFVEAAESKEALMSAPFPYITIRGRKGGSTVAVAIINALMKLAQAV